VRILSGIALLSSSLPTDDVLFFLENQEVTQRRLALNQGVTAHPVNVALHQHESDRFAKQVAG
jgi:hypothetical protein